MKPWIKRLADKREQERANRELEARFLRTAQSTAPILFRELAKEIEADVREYVEATGDRDLRITKREPTAITVQHDSLPAFTLNVSLQDHFIIFDGVAHDRRTSSINRFAGSIEIISKGLDQHFFRLDGNDHPTADTVSEHILMSVMNRP